MQHRNRIYRRLRHERNKLREIVHSSLVRNDLYSRDIAEKRNVIAEMKALIDRQSIEIEELNAEKSVLQTCLTIAVIVGILLFMVASYALSR